MTQMMDWMYGWGWPMGLMWLAWLAILVGIVVVAVRLLRPPVENPHGGDQPRDLHHPNHGSA
jgi:hypothetical protein